MERVYEHVWKADNAAEWTKLFAVRQVVEVYPDASLETEKKITLDYMRTHGWEHVRGSVYCYAGLKEPPIELSTTNNTTNIPLQHLKREHQKTVKLQNCYNCNQPGHYASACQSIYCRFCHQKGHMATACPQQTTSVICYQCGEKGHLKSACTVKEARCFSCRQTGHYSNQCPTKREPVHLSKTYGACYKCGQNGHWAASCSSSSSSNH